MGIYLLYNITCTTQGTNSLKYSIESPYPIRILHLACSDVYLGTSDAHLSPSDVYLSTQDEEFRRSKAMQKPDCI